MSWRDHAAPIIKAVVDKYSHDPIMLKAKLREAYPYGQRKYHPYKIWLDEIKRQLGTKEIKVKRVDQIEGQGLLLE
jgi:hypothetical protein